LKPENHKRIISGLEQYWSPEQIIGRYDIDLSAATIYRASENDMLPTVLREKLRQQGKSWLVDRKARFLVGKKLDYHRAETLKESICDSLTTR